MLTMAVPVSVIAVGVHAVSDGAAKTEQNTQGQQHDAQWNSSHVNSPYLLDVMDDGQKPR
jgi:hypothetical protein